MNDYKDKLKGLNKKVKSKKSTPVQNVAPVDLKDIKRTTVELPAHIHEAVKIHIATRRTTFKDWVSDLIIDELRREGVKL